MEFDRGLTCLLWLSIFTCRGVTGLSVVVSPSPTVQVVSGQTLSITCQWSADYTGQSAAVLYRHNDGIGDIGLLYISFGTACPSTLSYTFTCNRTTRTLGIQIPATSYSHGDRWTCEGRNNSFGNTTPPQTDTTTVEVRVPVKSVTINPSTNVTVDVGTSTTLTCTTQPHSRPTASVTWYRVVSGQPQQITANISVSHDTQNFSQTTTSVLSYVPSNEDNGRTVYCVSDGGLNGSTDTTLESARASLNVRYPPDTNPVLSGYDGSTKYIGDSVTLSCTVVGGNPAASLSLTCPDGTTSTSGTMTVTLSNTFHGGTCSCVGTHVVGGYSRTVATPTFIVNIPVTSVTINPSTSLTVDVGTSTSLTCTTQPHSRPTASVTWYRVVSGQPQQITANISVSHGTQNSVQTTTSVLSYVPSKEDNRRTVYCVSDGGRTGNTDTTLESGRVSLNVRYPPDTDPVVSGYDGSTKYKGESLTLSCTVVGGNPAASLSLTCPDGTTSTSGTMTVTLSNTFHHRTCSCVGTHVVGGYSRTVATPTFIVNIPVTSVTITPSTTVTVDVGTSTILTCITEPHTRPTASVTWYRVVSGQPQQITANISVSHDTQNSAKTTTSVLSFVPSKEDNGRTVYCVSDGGWTGSTDTNLRSGDVILNVRYPPTSTVIVTGNSDPVYDGDNIDLRCTIKGGNPLANLIWTCPGHGVTSTPANAADTTVAVLTISLTPLYNGANCTCTATHPVQGFRTSHTEVFNVYFAPRIHALTVTDLFPWLGRDDYLGRLSCDTTPGNPSTTRYTWYRDVTPISSQTSQVISFNPPTSTDNGRLYKCRAENDFTDSRGSAPESNTETIHVEYAPILTLLACPDAVNETDNYRCTCTAVGNPNPSVTWYPRDSSTNNIMDLPSINRNKAGRYTCNATSSSQKFGTLYTQSVLNLVVQYAPDVELLVQNATEHDTDLVMTCNAIGVPNVYTYGVWTHMYGTFTIRTLSGDGTTHGRTLTLASVSYQDIGTYICQVQNSIRGRDGQLIQTGTAVFDVEGVPRLLEETSRYITEKYQHLNITMAFISHPTPNDMFISKHDRLSSTRDLNITFIEETLDDVFYNKKIPRAGYRVNLEFPSFQIDQEGEYRLTVISDFPEKLVHIFDIIIIDVPDVPTIIKVNKITTQSAVVTWTAGLNRGRENQTFNVWIKEVNNDILMKFNVSNDMNNKEIMDLRSGSSYTVILFAENEKGRSENSTQQFKTLSEDDETSVAPLIGGVSGGFAALLIIVIVGVVLLRRRNNVKSKPSRNRPDTAPFNNAGDDDTDDGQDGMKMNILYESSDLYRQEVPNESGQRENAYAVVNKNKPPEGAANAEVTKNPAGAVYAEVIPKKDRKAAKGKAEEKPEGSEDLYAKVQKDKKTKKHEGKGKKKAQKGKGKKVQKNHRADDKSGAIYENFDVVNENQEEMYANGNNTSVATPNNKKVGLQETNNSRKMNKDGLIYLDLEFQQKSDGTRQAVIHGIENRNDYAIVDFTRHADPLPDDDDDAEANESKKADKRE